MSDKGRQRVKRVGEFHRCGKIYSKKTSFDIKKVICGAVRK